MSNILEVADVDKVFRTGFWMRPAQVLHSVRLSVPKGSIFGFLGPNGAGKTSLIQIIVGLRKATKGSVKVCGHDSSAPEARSNLGYLPERPYFYEHLTGEALLRFFGGLAGMSSACIEERIPAVLEQVGMSHARKRELKKYSKGMLQRIGIAQAILHDPEFLVLDEPMSGLDPVGRKEMRELILKLASEGRTVFFSSHVIPDVEAICDQVGVIQKGRMIGCGPIGQFLAQGPLQTEIGFRGLTLEQARAFPAFVSMRAIPDAIRGVVSGQEAVNEALARLIALGAEVLWVTPIRPSLEDLFFDSKARDA